jgi:hypothetical protein
MNEVRTTGQVAALLAVTEPQLNDLIRRGKINPAPSVVAGRRAWLRQHVAQAADLLGATFPAEATTASTGGAS